MDYSTPGFLFHPRACSNSCPSSWWCHPTISSSVILFSSCLQSFPTLWSFLMSQFFSSGGQSIGASPSVLPMNIQDWFPLGWLIWSLSSPRDPQEFSPTPQFKSIKSLFFKYACIKCSSIFWSIPSLFNFLWSIQWRQKEYITSYIVKCYQRSWRKKDTGHFQSIYSESASGWHWLKYYILQNVWKKVNWDQQKYFGPSSEDSFGCHDFHVF